jgi:hypothetical protein
MKSIRASLFAFVTVCGAALHATPVTVQELGVGPNEVVQISATNLGTANVYASTVNLLVNGNPTVGFCIDPWHWSANGPMSYDLVGLDTAPKPANNNNVLNPMGTLTAQKIEQLWQQYYTPNLSNTTAAGMQIAIWELVDLAVGGASFSLLSGNDYGAANMIAWVNANPNAPTANLMAVVSLTNSGQDYVIQTPVPDVGATIVYLLLGALSLGVVRRRTAA